MGPVGKRAGGRQRSGTNPFRPRGLATIIPRGSFFHAHKTGKNRRYGQIVVQQGPDADLVDEELHAHQQAARAALRAITVEQGNSAAGVRDANLVSLHGEYVAGLGPLFTAKLTVERLKAELACALGEDDGITGLVSWARKTRATPETTVFDKTAFKKVHPELLQAYTGPATYSTAFNMSSVVLTALRSNPSPSCLISAKCRGRGRPFHHCVISDPDAKLQASLFTSGWHGSIRARSADDHD